MTRLWSPSKESRISVAPVATKMRVAAPRPNIALLLAERGDKPPQREAIEVPIHGDADAAGNFDIQQGTLRHHRGHGTALDNLHGKKCCSAGRILRGRRRCLRG